MEWICLNIIITAAADAVTASLDAAISLAAAASPAVRITAAVLIYQALRDRQDQRAP